MNESKPFLNGNTSVIMRIASLVFQALIVVGMFWVGSTFVRKTDFDAYKKEQETAQVEHLKQEYARSELLSRLEERLRALQEKK